MSLDIPSRGAVPQGCGVPSAVCREGGWGGGVSTASRRSMPAGGWRSEAFLRSARVRLSCSAALLRRGCRLKPAFQAVCAVLGCGVPSAVCRGGGWGGGVSTASRRSMPAGGWRSGAFLRSARVRLVLFRGALAPRVPAEAGVPSRGAVLGVGFRARSAVEVGGVVGFRPRLGGRCQPEAGAPRRSCGLRE